MGKTGKTGHGTQQKEERKRMKEEREQRKEERK